MKFPDSFEAFQRSCRGWCHGPRLVLPDPPEPEPGLNFFGRLRWHVREYFRPKSEWERFVIKYAKLRQQ
jgi:hypothetical protein